MLYNANMGILTEIRKRCDRIRKEQDRRPVVTNDTTPRSASPKPVTTIYSDEDSPRVPLQIRYTSTKSVIPSSWADETCEGLGTETMLVRLNRLMRTDYSLDTPGMRDDFQYCITRGLDFGMAYSLLRSRSLSTWGRGGLEEKVNVLEDEDGTARRTAITADGRMIMEPSIPPRRLWDLYSNRVVPWWCYNYTRYNIFAEGWNRRTELYAVSHSWMDVTQRHAVSTTVNGHEWPVPIPIDTSLDRVRVELLNLGAKYAWLDVLCLRQEGSQNPEKEAKRIEEWRLDVPTIGAIYRAARWFLGPVKCVTYFDGLGRPFKISDIHSPRHWLNRAWTLQEAYRDTIIGGLTVDSPFPRLRAEDIVDPRLRQFYARFAKMCQVDRDIFGLVETMRERSSTSKMDQVAGLAYALDLYTTRCDPPSLPTYIQSEEDVDLEGAWNYLISTEKYDTARLQLLFLYPIPGDRCYTWMPSWRQLQTLPLPRPGCSVFFSGRYLKCSVCCGLYTLPDGYVIEGCMIEGFAEPGRQGCNRKGNLIVIRNQKAYTFTMTAGHDEPIPTGEYIVVGLCFPQRSQYVERFWILGHAEASGRIRKVSVLTMEDQKEWVRVFVLKLGKKEHVPLV